MINNNILKEQVLIKVNELFSYMNFTATREKIEQLINETDFEEKILNKYNINSMFDLLKLDSLDRAAIMDLFAIDVAGVKWPSNVDSMEYKESFHNKLKENYKIKGYSKLIEQ